MSAKLSGNHRSQRVGMLRDHADGVGARRFRAAARLAMAVLASGLMFSAAGCETVGDYLNLRNSFLNPAEVGRFDKANPYGDVKPVKWPILEQLEAMDEPSGRWANATDPVPADLVPEAKEFALGPGDTLRISIYELLAQGMEYVKEVRVNEVGAISLQNVGTVQVGGLTPTQAEQKIAQILVEEKLLPPAGNGQPGPQVSVMLLDSRQRVFSILGAVTRPGTYNVLTNDFRLLDALALAADIPVQPGLDYLYVIRPLPYQRPGTTTAPAVPVPPVPTGTGGAATGKSPLDVLESIEKGGTQPSTAPGTTGPSPAPSTTPATTPTPSAGGPVFLRPLPTAMVAAHGAGPALAQASAPDLEAALNIPGAATTSAPAAGAAKAPAADGSATGAAPTTRDQDLLNKAMNAGAPSQFIYIDGKWVAVPTGTTTAPATTGTAAAPTAAAPTATAPTTETATGQPETVPTTETATTLPTTTEGQQLSQQRVIRIPIALLREGVSKYNIIIRPGDIINIPPVEPGEFYVMGNVTRPGVYTLTGRKITLKMAVAAAGNLGPLAIPRRCELTRRIGEDQEAIIQINMQAIFDGEQPDIFLKPNDVVNVGTDAIAPFLAVTRNAYRASYGWGFIYDRNFYIQPTRTVQ